MPEWTGQIEFGVSVFHAYSHQWTCQLWYHPQKSEKWGLSDGEGCERFWNELKQEGAGKWLHDHVSHTVGHEAQAQEKLDGASVQYLLGQFKEQHSFQSRLVPHQSNTKGSSAIEHILSMSQSAGSLQVHLKELMDELAGLATNNVTIAVEDELWLKITEIWASVQCLESNISRKTQELHLSDQKSHKELEWLKTNKWINLQLNVQVVRDQLLMKLHACKFELAGLEHADTSHQLDHKTKEHVEKAMKGQVSGIQATLK
ncbi:hypothetical protein BS47DRAFT_1368953 [Hydnum rufescens UP504]|uniref:Uncharacterized protein n=1 Tax=Hydnum rufescens UP504 TaxID=1448309 RepID=A0A9P6AEP6_9AGAM|nr:hypothetical protein BS47DRAFT_1368953 [Hydnum rufescens UP504]